MDKNHFVDNEIQKMIEKIRKQNPGFAKYLEANIIITDEGICYKGKKPDYKK